MTDVVNILCMKWGDYYGPEYANRLYHGVCRHLARPFRFVCFTDDATGLDAGIEALPLPDEEVGGSADLRWRKVSVFKPELFGLTGPALFLDLDTVIVGRLDALFDLPGDFLVCHERTLFPKRFRNLRRALFNRRRYRQANAEGNTSVFRFQIGEMGFVWEHYLSDPARVVGKYRREQEYVCDQARRGGLLRHWPASLCVSYRDNCKPGGAFGRFRARRLPADARVVIFTSGLTMERVLSGTARELLRPAEDVAWLRAAWRDAPCLPTAGDTIDE